MKIIFMGSGDIAIPTVTKLIELDRENQIKLISIYTSPDKPHGRGLKTKQSNIIEFINSQNKKIPIHQPKTIKSQQEIEKIKNLNPDLIIVMAYGFIIPKDILDIPTHACINIHTSLLPKYRGASPIQEAIINGETKSGITIMYMNEGLDTGDIIEKKTIPLDENETGKSLHDKLALISPNLTTKIINDIKNKNINKHTQDNSKASYSKKITKNHGLINWNETAEHISRKIHAYHTWPGTFTFFKQPNKEKIFRTKILPPVKPHTKLHPHNNNHSNSQCGQITHTKNNTYLIKCGKDSENSPTFLEINKLQIEGKKLSNIENFQKGYPTVNKFINKNL